MTIKPYKFNRLSYEFKNIKNYYWKNLHLDCKNFVYNFAKCLNSNGGTKKKLALNKCFLMVQ